MYKKISLADFPKEREQKLKSIYRYNLFDTMQYRSNLFEHVHRVLWLLEELIPVARKHLSFDPEKARALALVHDDAEMVTGDVQAGVKERMSKKELLEVENDEEKAIDVLADKFPKKVHGYSYKSLLLHALKKDCVEAELVSYVDKIDGQCESLHEVLSGNISLLRSVRFYDNALALFPQKFPKLIPLLSDKISPLTHLRDVVNPYMVHAKHYKHLNKPFTKKSIKHEEDFPFYNTWKKILIKHGQENFLIKRREFLPK